MIRLYIVSEKSIEDNLSLALSIMSFVFGHPLAVNGLERGLKDEAHELSPAEG
jgi:hypothetical protein